MRTSDQCVATDNEGWVEWGGDLCRSRGGCRCLMTKRSCKGSVMGRMFRVQVRLFWATGMHVNYTVK